MSRLPAADARAGGERAGRARAVVVLELRDPGTAGVDGGCRNGCSRPTNPGRRCRERERARRGQVDRERRRRGSLDASEVVRRARLHGVCAVGREACRRERVRPGGGPVRGRTPVLRSRTRSRSSNCRALTDPELDLLEPGAGIVRRGSAEPAPAQPALQESVPYRPALTGNMLPSPAAATVMLGDAPRLVSVPPTQAFALRRPRGRTGGCGPRPAAARAAVRDGHRRARGGVTVETVIVWRGDGDRARARDRVARVSRRDARRAPPGRHDDRHAAGAGPTRGRRVREGLGVAGRPSSPPSA